MEETTVKFEDNISMEDVTNSALDFVQPNRIIQGEVVTIDDEFAYVNVGTKSDGRVALEEFDVIPDIGDIIDVVLIEKRMIDGMYVFSKTAAEMGKKWKNFMENYNKGEDNILGIVKGAVNKGISVDCDGINAFLPFSHAANIRINQNKVPEGSIWFKLKRIDEDRQTIIISRKDYLEEEYKKTWNNFILKYNIGDSVVGKVEKFVDSGVFIDIDGLKAFMKRDDISWKKVFKKKNIIKIDEVREFAILGINSEENKITLGLKQLTEDPWLQIDNKYKVDEIVSGTVVTVTNSGAFIEIDDGIEGFVNSSNISWTKRNVNPRDIFQKGKKIDVKILDINKEERRLTLGIKQVFPNPWDTIEERFPINSKNLKKIKKIVNFGMFVELEEGIDGLIHISDISWDDNLKEPLKLYKEGDDVEFIVLDINNKEMKIACGIKQLTKSPWEKIKEEYLPRSKVSGVISGIVPFGLFVKINDDVEGLVHISEVSTSKIENLKDYYKIGDEVEAVVLGIDVKRKRLSLSIKEYSKIADKEEMKKILSDTSSKTVTLGDFIKIELNNQA